MQIKDSVALVTGANRGLGRVFIQALVAAGARKVYAGVRDPASFGEAMPGVEVVKLDVTSAEDIAAAAKQCGDVSLLINNAGISDDRGANLLDPDAVAAVRREFETNFFGILNLSRAFAPILAQSQSSAILDVLSTLSWINLPTLATYSTSKAAAWSLTNGLRRELKGQGTQVTALHVGYMDTDLARHVEAVKTAPEEVARLALLGLEAGVPEVLADAGAHHVRAGLSTDQAVYF
ncbi:SDR family oxidoreductase [Deinococcus sp. UYEF24]